MFLFFFRVLFVLRVFVGLSYFILLVSYGFVVVFSGLIPVDFQRFVMFCLGVLLFHMFLRLFLFVSVFLRVPI